MFRTRLVAAATAAAASAVVLSLAPAADAGSAVRHLGIGIKLLDAPSNLANDPRAHSYIIDVLRPGATIVRHVEVSNDTGQSAHVLLYADAATIGGGTFQPGRGHSVNELTGWTTISPSSVDLPQGGNAVATVTVHVPKTATNGERYGVILADLPPQTSPTGVGVQVESRVGIRMYLQVEHSGVATSNFTIDTLTAKRAPSGAPVIEAQVHNVGQRALDMRGGLKLSNGPGGLAAGPFPAQLGTTLAPGQTEPVTVVLNKALPAGPWQARIDLYSGLLHRAAEGTVTFPSSNGASSAPVKATAVSLTRNRHVLVPIAIGLILGVVVGIVLFLLWRRRRRDDEEQDGGDGPSAPSVPAQRAKPRARIRQ